MPTTQRVLPVVEPILSDLGLDLYDLDFAGGVLRVLIDVPGGIGIDDLATATRLISRALDDEETITGSYTLEVSSPGVERPLRTPAHFAAAVDAVVSIKTTPGHEGERRVRGTLRAADDDTITVVDENDAEHRIPLTEIEQARTVFEWGSDRPATRGTSAPTPTEKARVR